MRVDVKPPENRPPVLADVASPILVTSGESLELEIKADDKDLPNDKLSFSKEDLEAVGVTIKQAKTDSTKAILEWKPKSTQKPGKYGIKVEVSDKKGEACSKNLVIHYNRSAVWMFENKESIEENVILRFDEDSSGKTKAQLDCPSCRYRNMTIELSSTDGKLSGHGDVVLYGNRKGEIKTFAMTVSDVFVAGCATVNREHLKVWRSAASYDRHKGEGESWFRVKPLGTWKSPDGKGTISMYHDGTNVIVAFKEAKMGNRSMWGRLKSIRGELTGKAWFFSQSEDKKEVQMDIVPVYTTKHVSLRITTRIKTRRTDGIELPWDNTLWERQTGELYSSGRDWAFAQLKTLDKSKPEPSSGSRE